METDFTLLGPSPLPGHIFGPGRNACPLAGFQFKVSLSVLKRPTVPPTPAASAAGESEKTLPRPERLKTPEKDLGAEWMLALQAGEASAFDQIVSGYQSCVFHFLFRTVRDWGRAEDLTQDVFVRVYRSRARYRPLSSFKTWIFTIASRLALNEVRAVRRRRRVFAECAGSSAPGKDSCGDDGEDFWASIPDRAVETPFEPLERKEMEDLIDELLERLPENQRAALQLQRSERYSYQEIAGVLEVSTMAVKSLLVRARENLKRELERYLDGKNKLIGRKS